MAVEGSGGEDLEMVAATPRAGSADLPTFVEALAAKLQGKPQRPPLTHDSGRF